MSSKFVSVALAAALLTLGACSKPPQAEIESSKASLATVEQTQASRYAPTEWAAAQEAAHSVDAEVEAQAGKFALTRSYERTNELLAEANAKADAARAAAVANKEAAQHAAQTQIEAAHTSLAAARGLVAELEACPRKPKGFDADMAVLTGNLNGLESGLSGLDQAVEAENFDTAGVESENLRQQLDVLVADMQAAKSKIRC